MSKITKEEITELLKDIFNGVDVTGRWEELKSNAVDKDVLILFFEQMEEHIEKLKTDLFPFFTPSILGYLFGDTPFGLIENPMEPAKKTIKEIKGIINENKNTQEEIISNKIKSLKDLTVSYYIDIDDDDKSAWDELDQIYADRFEKDLYPGYPTYIEYYSHFSISVFPNKAIEIADQLTKNYLNNVHAKDHAKVQENVSVLGPTSVNTRSDEGKAQLESVQGSLSAADQSQVSREIVSTNTTNTTNTTAPQHQKQQVKIGISTDPQLQQKLLAQEIYYSYFAKSSISYIVPEKEELLEKVRQFIKDSANLKLICFVDEKNSSSKKPEKTLLEKLAGYARDTKTTDVQKKKICYEIMAMLIAAGPKYQGYNLQGYNPYDKYLEELFVSIAPKRNSKQLLTALINKGVPVDTFFGGTTALIQATRATQEDNVALLINLSANVNLKTEKNGDTALHCSIKECKPVEGKDLETLIHQTKFLLKNGAKTDIVNGKGETPLIKAIVYPSINSQFIEILAANVSEAEWVSSIKKVDELLPNANKSGRTRLLNIQEILLRHKPSLRIEEQVDPIFKLNNIIDELLRLRSVDEEVEKRSGQLLEIKNQIQQQKFSVEVLKNQLINIIDELFKTEKYNESHELNIFKQKILELPINTNPTSEKTQSEGEEDQPEGEKNQPEYPAQPEIDNQGKSNQQTRPSTISRFFSPELSKKESAQKDREQKDREGIFCSMRR